MVKIMLTMRNIAIMSVQQQNRPTQRPFPPLVQRLPWASYLNALNVWFLDRNCCQSGRMDHQTTQLTVIVFPEILGLHEAPQTHCPIHFLCYPVFHECQLLWDHGDYRARRCNHHHNCIPLDHRSDVADEYHTDWMHLQGLYNVGRWCDPCKPLEKQGEGSRWRFKALK